MPSPTLRARCSHAIETTPCSLTLSVSKPSNTSPHPTARVANAVGSQRGRNVYDRAGQMSVDRGPLERGHQPGKKNNQHKEINFGEITGTYAYFDKIMEY